MGAKGALSRPLPPVAANVGAAPNAIGVPPTIWLDANTLKGADGTAVSSWQDKASGLAFTQGTGGNQPVLKIAPVGFNGNNTVRFDGTNDYVSLTSSITCQYGALFTVAFPASIVDQFVVNFRGAPSYWDVNVYPNARVLQYRTGDAGGATTASTISPQMVAAFSCANLPSGSFGFFNGRLTQRGTAAASGTLTAFGVGCNDPGGTPASFFNGDIAEVIFYTRSLTEAQINAVNRYLVLKYKIGGES